MFDFHFESRHDMASASESFEKALSKARDELIEKQEQREKQAKKASMDKFDKIFNGLKLERISDIYVIQNEFNKAYNKACNAFRS